MIETIVKEKNVQLLERVHQLGSQVGHTPLQLITEIFSKKGVFIYAKQEWKQLSGSVKCRAAYNILHHAVSTGVLNEEITLLDATSGNTGIAYATLGAKLGIRVALCLPENASAITKERLKWLGVTIISTSRFEGTDGAQQVAAELAAKYPHKYFYADQYKNPNNWKAHYHTTSVEIFSALPAITHFVAGLGTTGTFVGTGRRLKELNVDIHLTALQPDSALHGLEGWKHLETAIVPKIYDPTVADEQLEISTEEAYEVLKAASRYEGLSLSPSSAANLAGAIRIAEKLDHGIVVTVLPDNADKYTDSIKQWTYNAAH